MAVRTSNIVALAAAAVLIIAGLLWLNAGPKVDECAKWQRAVRHEARLIASQREGNPKTFLDEAANAFNESRPDACVTPTDIAGD